MSQSLPDANASTPRLPPRGALRRILEAIGVQNVSLLIALALLVAFIGGQNSNFFYSSNIATIGTTVAIVGILSVVQTVVMLLGGLDISVSSQAGLTSVVSAMVFMATQSAFAGIVAALVYAGSVHAFLTATWGRLLLIKLTGIDRKSVV